MGLGGISTTITTGGKGAAQSPGNAVRQLVVVGVSSLATPTVTLRPQSTPALKSGAGAGQMVEAAAKIMSVPGAPPPLLLPVTASATGAAPASLTQTGTGVGTITPTIAPHLPITILCSTGGSIGTAYVQFSLDGGATYTLPIKTASTMLVPGTFCTLAFAAATYVAAKTNTVACDGTVTPGSAWVGTVTISCCSPVDSYNLVATVATGGALGVSTLQVSLDAGITTLPTLMVPVGGMVIVPGTGIVLTCAGVLTKGDTYSGPFGGTSCSSSDLTTALTAYFAATPPPPLAGIFWITPMPSSASSAMTVAAAVDSALSTAFALGFSYEAIMDCPSKSGGYTAGGNSAGVGCGDIIVSTNALFDTADTDAVVRAARAGHTFNRVTVCVGTNPQASAVGGNFLCRGTSWPLAVRIAGTDPSTGVAARSLGQVDVYAIGRDERLATTTLFDAQFTTLQTLLSGDPVFAIEAGGLGWRNMTTDADYQDADAMRALNAMLGAVYPVANNLLGARPAANTDGTIEEKTRLRYAVKVRGAAQRSMAVNEKGAYVPGGGFNVKQASLVDVDLLPSSMVGASPYELDFTFTFQRLGFVSAIKFSVTYSGTAGA